MSQITEPGCALCVNNGKLEIISDLADTLLVEARQRVFATDEWVAIDGAYQLVTTSHVPCGERLHFNYYDDLLDAASRLKWSGKVGEVDMISMNLTPRGGRTVDHTHAWLIDRERVEQWLREKNGITDVTIRHVGLVAILEELLVTRDELRQAYADNGDARWRDIT